MSNLSTYRKNKEAGLCVKCGGSRSGSQLKCDPCRERLRTTYYKRRVRFAAAGCHRCGGESSGKTKLCETCLKRERDYHQRQKQELMSAYGGRCQCCGESDLRFLSIDHVDGTGSQDRKINMESGGRKFYARLRRLGYPTGFQILCFNCNIGRSFNGGVCPHRDSSTKPLETLH